MTKYKPNFWKEKEIDGKILEYPYYRDLSLEAPSRDKPLCIECFTWLKMIDCILHNYICVECRLEMICPLCNTKNDARHLLKYIRKDAFPQKFKCRNKDCNYSYFWQEYELQGKCEKCLKNKTIFLTYFPPWNKTNEKFLCEHCRK